ncbi:hypothetical protein DL93DRAFT_813662 [Clavulina sp. PMI_390]|nr:hypothetical protein DL93DRAFT_813662 [Clavulina sp. PMI_390]
MSVGYFIDAESPILSFNGPGWIPILTGNPGNAPFYNNKTGMYTNATGDSIKISFFGTGIDIYGSKLSTHGPFNVTLDGVTTSGTTYSPTDEWATLIYSSPLLNRGPHSFTITDVPAAADRSILGVDYMIVKDASPSFPASQISLFVDDTNKAVFNYLPSSNSWESTPDSESLGGSLSRTQSQVGGVEIHFTGSSIALYGRVGQSNAGYLCSIDGGANVSYTGFWVESASQQTLYLANNLTGGGAEHVLRVWNVPDASNGHIWLEIDYVQLWGSSGWVQNSGVSTSCGFC